MLYLQESSEPVSGGINIGNGGSDSGKGQEVDEDEVDKVLAKTDGRIVRKKDPQL